MKTQEKVIALIRFYSRRYNLSSAEWLEALIELESDPRGGELNEPRRVRNPPYVCLHCGARAEYGMGAAHHHTAKHRSCPDKHDYSDPEKRVSLNGT